MYDSILRNYNDIHFVLNMDIEDFNDQFIKLREKELEQRVWEIWLAEIPIMTQENYMSYDDMLNMVKQKETKKDIPTNGVYIDQCFF